MHNSFLRRPLGGLLLGLGLLLSSCATKPLHSPKPLGPDYGMLVMGLRNIPEGQRAKVTNVYFLLHMVTFDNLHLSGTDDVPSTLKPGEIMPGYSWLQGCLEGDVCLRTNLRPGRYRIYAFVQSTGGGEIIYDISNPVVQEGKDGRLDRLLGRTQRTIYSPDDLYVIVPPGGIGYAGSFTWHNKMEFTFGKIKFDFQRDRDRPESDVLLAARTQLRKLASTLHKQDCAMPEATNHATTPMRSSCTLQDWQTMVDQRLAKIALRTPAAPAAAPVVPAKAGKKPKAAKASKPAKP